MLVSQHLYNVVFTSAPGVLDLRSDADPRANRWLSKVTSAINETVTLLKCSVEQFDVGSLPIIETQKSHWNEETTSLSGTLVFDSARWAHLPGCLFLRKPFYSQTNVSQVFYHCFSMQRFVSKRSTSSDDLASSSFDDVRAKRAAIALSVGLCWPPAQHAISLERPSMRPRRERALQEHILHHHELPLATPATALVEDEPSGSTEKRRKVHVHSTVRDWFLYMLDQRMTHRRWGMQQCLCEVQRLCPGMFDGINPNTPNRWKWSAPRAGLRKKTLLSPADMTRLSEHILRVTDVLCLSGLTIHGLVLDWLDAEGHDVRPSEWLTTKYELSSFLRGQCDIGHSVIVQLHAVQVACRSDWILWWFSLRSTLSTDLSAAAVFAFSFSIALHLSRYFATLIHVL